MALESQPAEPTSALRHTAGTNAVVLAWESPPKHIACQVLHAVCSLQLMQSPSFHSDLKKHLPAFTFFFSKLNEGHEVEFSLPDSMAAHVPV